jgi:hypothetical protein
MLLTLQAILAFLQTHLLLTGSLSGWAALSLLVNVVLAVKGPAAWVAYAEESPTVALIVNVLFRDFGIDLVSVIQHVQAYLNTLAALKAAKAKAAARTDDTAPPPKSEKGK